MGGVAPRMKRRALSGEGLGTRLRFYCIAGNLRAFRSISTICKFCVERGGAHTYTIFTRTYMYVTWKVLTKHSPILTHDYLCLVCTYVICIVKTLPPHPFTPSHPHTLTPSHPPPELRQELLLQCQYGGDSLGATQ